MLKMNGQGGLFTRLGRLVGMLKSQSVYQSGTLVPSIQAISAEYSTLPSPIAGLARASKQSPPPLTSSALEIYVIDAAIRTLIEMLTEDQPNESWDVPKSTAEVIRQMQAQGHAVAECNTSFTVDESPVLANPGSPNAGNGFVQVELTESSYLDCQNVFAEQVRLSVYDAAAPGSELWVARGAPANGAWSYNWPQGSGAEGQYITVDPTIESDSNLILDPSFESWTDETTLGANNGKLISWTGVNVERSTDSYNQLFGTTAYALSFVGSNFGLSGQAWASTDASSVRQIVEGLAPSTLYSFSARAKLQGASFSSLTTATVSASLVDPRTGATLVDFGGNALSAKKTWVSKTDVDWALITETWITPRKIPPVVVLDIKTENVTAIASGASGGFGIIDDVCLTPMTYLYAGGPAISIIRGNVDFQVGDSFEITISNDRAGQFAGFTWQAIWDRLFGTRSLGLYLPSSKTPTIIDSLMGSGSGGSISPLPPPPPPPPPPTGSIRVRSWYDNDSDGLLDNNEAMASNRLVSIVGPVTISRTTPGNGLVAFGAIPTGKYAVSIVTVPGEMCPNNGGFVTVLSNTLSSVDRPIQPSSPPPPATYSIVVSSPDTPLRAIQLTQGLTNKNVTLDALGKYTFAGLTAAVGDVLSLSLVLQGTETAIWSSYSSPNSQNGSGYLATCKIGGDSSAINSYVNYAVSQGPNFSNNRLTVRVVDEDGGLDIITGRTVTIVEAGISATLNANGGSFATAIFNSPLLTPGQYTVNVSTNSGDPLSVWRAYYRVQNSQVQTTAGTTLSANPVGVGQDSQAGNDYTVEFKFPALDLPPPPPPPPPFATGNVRVRVIDASGNPIATTVTLSGVGTESTDGAGWAYFTAPAGLYTASTPAPGSSAFTMGWTINGPVSGSSSGTGYSAFDVVVGSASTTSTPEIVIFQQQTTGVGS
jgi:hypothetical protein